MVAGWCFPKSTFYSTSTCLFLPISMPFSGMKPFPVDDHKGRETSWASWAKGPGAWTEEISCPGLWKRKEVSKSIFRLMDGRPFGQPHLELFSKIFLKRGLEEKENWTRGD